jgi:hypothetical protein
MSEAAATPTRGHPPDIPACLLREPSPIPVKEV